MKYIEFLGTSGTKSTTDATTCLRVSQHCLIDAGNIIEGMGEHLYDVEHVFLTHSHLDHIIDIPFVADLFVLKQSKPLKVYGLKETLQDLQQFIFNYKVWPDFAQINLLNHEHKTIEFVEISLDQRYTIDNVTLTPFKTNHTEGSCGYLIESEGHGLLFTSDTYRCPKIWEILDANPHIHSLIVDVSFPSEYDQLAYDSKHMTPKILFEELQLSQRNDFRIYPIHLKPLLNLTIGNELETYGIFERGGHILESYECLCFNPKCRPPRSNRRIERSVVSQIIAIGTALSTEKNIDRLLETIIIHTKVLTHADGGTLYLYHPKTEQLEFKVIQNDSLRIHMGGSADPITWEKLNLYDANGAKNLSMVAAVCALENRVVNIPNVYESTLYDFSGTIEFDKNNGYVSQSMLVVPLKDHEDNLIGVLQLINKKDGIGTILPFDPQDEEIALSLGSQAAVTLTKQKLINDLELLLESFLNTINVAIEEKSPYTAGHIDRMVDLSMVLAHAIHDDRDTFPHITYTSDQFKEIKFAALMHDIGKITTPEHIIDKATKLQTIYDRIATVELRFELLKRDAYTDYLERKTAASDEAAQKESEERYRQTLQELDEDLEFLKTANQGSEYFPDNAIERVRAIARKKVNINGEMLPLLEEDEVHNLTVQKGTLTEEQRMIINNHATVSLKMLQKLPFPRKFQRVPEIASAHHEKINGKGYPLGLQGDELSMEARILAIADIFEALSASDRPYKKAKKLSEVMKILYFMAKDNDIDRDIVRFFYQSGLYLHYAKSILKEEYIDEAALDFDALKR